MKYLLVVLSLISFIMIFVTGYLAFVENNIFFGIACGMWVFNTFNCIRGVVE